MPQKAVTMITVSAVLAILLSGVVILLALNNFSAIMCCMETENPSANHNTSSHVTVT